MIDHASEEHTEAAYRLALDSAVRSLGQREHSRRELEHKLERKGHSKVLVARVLDYLCEHDLQSDARFAESFVRGRVEKGYGPVKIRQELASRGVSEHELECQLTEPAEFWLARARRALEKRYGEAEPGISTEPDAGDVRPEEARRRAWNARARFLARRGFPSDLIYRVLGAL